MDSLNVIVSDAAFPLTPEEIAVQQSDIAAEEKKVEEIRERAAAELAAKMARLADARQQPDVLNEFNYAVDGRQYKVMISNSYLWTSYHMNPYRQGYVWFGVLLGLEDVGRWNGLGIQTSCSSSTDLIIVMPHDMRAQFLAALDSARAKWRVAHGEFSPTGRTKEYCHGDDIGLK